MFEKGIKPALVISTLEILAVSVALEASCGEEPPPPPSLPPLPSPPPTHHPPTHHHQQDEDTSHVDKKGLR